MTQHQITNAPAAIVTGQVEAEEEVRARAVRYVPDRDAIEIVTTRNAGFLIPREWIGALQDVPTEISQSWISGRTDRRSNSKIATSTSACLITAILPAMLPPQAVAAIFASRGGKATSDDEREP
jgi:hypothetical protein